MHNACDFKYYVDFTSLILELLSCEWKYCEWEGPKPTMKRRKEYVEGKWSGVVILKNTLVNARKSLVNDY